MIASGLAAKGASAESIAVANPSFEADNFGTWPGYRGGANPAAITGWSNGGGINGSDLGAGSPFADNGAYPDGTRVAFIQGTGTLSQALGGFVVGDRYWVQVWMNARACCGDTPSVRVSLGGQTLLAPINIQPVGGTSPYHFANFQWTANTPTAQLVIGSAATAGGDASAVFDGVAVIRRGADEILLANPSFEASGTQIAFPGYHANIAGWRKTGASQIGINTADGPFHDNGIVPDGPSVLLLQGDAGVEQGIAGLAPGGSYRLSLRYNARAGTPAPTFRVTVDGETAFQGTVASVGAGQPYHALVFDFTAGAETLLLALANLGANADDTVLVDDVRISATGTLPAPTPAFAQPGAAGAAGGIVTFNEIHYHPAEPEGAEWVELVNQFGTRLDLGGWRITGGIDYTFPEGTLLEAGGFVLVSKVAGDPAGALGPFTGNLDGSGDTVRLRTRQGWLVDEVNYGVSGAWPSAPDGTGVTLAKRGVSLASDTAASWVASAEPGGTPGIENFAVPPQLAQSAPPAAGSVVINEIFYHAPPTYAEGATPYAENPAEWVELHNRGAAPVDLGGWRFSDGIAYTFPPGTSLAAGGFLVLDHSQFSGSLANSGERVRLRDALGALVDEVRYRDRGRWAAAADGGGSSLELIDPGADNAVPESWAASDEGAKTGWVTYTYTASGAEPPGSNNPSNWREFLVGLLDAGEVLIDDLSVRRDPAGANAEVIQNGTFEGDVIGQAPQKWRCLGTHKLSVVVANPDGPGKVLKIVATDALEHTYNNGSTTLVGNQAIDPTKSYRVTFRAKWLSGSPQLNTRLYLNRAARTTILPQPATAGTPGAPNSRRIPNAGPTFAGFVHVPLVPAIGQPVTVFARPQDPDGLGAQTLYYSVNGGPFVSVPMADDGTGLFTAQVPGQPLTGMVVQIYVRGTDGSGAMSDFPPEGPASRALYRVGDGGVSAVPLANRLRLIMRPDDAAAMHAPVHSVSNFRWPATLIANEREVFYDVRVRLRSAPFGRQGNRVGWNLRFDPEQPFRGTETSLVIDGAFNMPRGDGSGWLENSLGPSVNELLYLRVSERAGHIPSELPDVCYFSTPYYESRRAQLRLRRYNNSALDAFTPGGGDGSLFKQELVYYPTTTVDENPESFKNPYSAVLAVDILEMGADKEAYRHNYLVQNHSDRDDFSGVLAMTSAFSQSNANLYTASEAALDLESWTRTLALNALLGLADTYNQHLAHNIQFLARPSDGRVMLLPWDMDHAFYFATNFSLYGGAAHRVKDLVNDPRVRRRIAGHHLDFCQTAFSNAYLDAWVDHYSALADKPGHAGTLKNWITARRSYVLTRLAAEWPSTPFAITSNGGADFSVATPVATLTGTGWIDVHSIRLAGAATPLTLTWINGTTWQVTVPLGAGANAITLEARDLQSGVTGADSIVVTNSGPLVPASSENLVLAEVMYHPADPSLGEQADGFLDANDFEFLELLNIGAGPIDLRDATFAAGISYTFPTTTLEPGERLLLASNASAFAARYGAAIPVFGIYTGRLSNSGERILLLDRGGQTIVDFTYRDDSGWPPEVDGGGFSLTLRDPLANPDSTSPASWRVSTSPGGSPGSGDALDPASFATLLDYALASRPVATLEGGFATFAWRERLGADTVTVTPQITTDSVAWREGDALVPLDDTVNSDGTRTLRVRSAAPVGAREFFRLEVRVP